MLVRLVLFIQTYFLIFINIYANQFINFKKEFKLYNLAYNIFNNDKNK